MKDVPDTCVYVLHHTHQMPDGNEEVKLIGIYSSLERAESAKFFVEKLPGFCHAPDGFSIDCYKLDKTQWNEGFTTIYSGFE